MWVLKLVSELVEEWRKQGSAVFSMEWVVTEPPFCFYPAVSPIEILANAIESCFFKNVENAPNGAKW